jgi:hypothetical protein
MGVARHSSFLLFLLTLLYFNFYALGPSPRHTGNGTRVHFGPVIGFYNISARHAISPSAKMSLLAGFSREVHVDREYRTFFLFGINYFFHGLNFRSYYFKPDSLQLYDRSFRYNYSLLLQELQIPLQVKFLFNREDNNLFSPYVNLGYHLRYMLPATLQITENGAKVKNDYPEMKFRTPLILDGLNSFVSVGFGWQNNSLTSSKGNFFAEINYRYGFSSYYFESGYSPSSLFINSSHLTLQLGLKF